MVVKFEEEFVSEDDKLCIVSEFVNGGDFEKFIKGRKALNLPFSNAEILKYFALIAIGVNYIHS